MGSRFFMSAAQFKTIASIAFLFCLGFMLSFGSPMAQAQTPAPTATPVPPPTITDVRTSPASGSIRTATEGSQVYIIGTNFTGATAVDFNGTAATFTPVNNTTILAIVPTGATVGPIHVTTPTGTASSPFFFNVVAPAPTNTPVPAPTATAVPNPGKIKIELPARPTIVEEDSSATNVFTVVLECATSNNANVPPQASVVVELEATAPGFSPVLSPSVITFPAGSCPAAVSVSMPFTGDDAIQGDQNITISATSTSADTAYNGLAAAGASIVRNDQHGAYATIIDSPRTSETDQRTGRVSNFKIALQNEDAGILDDLDRPITAGDLVPTGNVFVKVSVANAPGHEGGADEAKIFTDTQRIANTSQILIFSPSNYKVLQNIYVQGLDDTDMDGDTLYTVAVSLITSSDPEYHQLPLNPPAGNYIVNVDDEADDNQANELPGVLISPATSPSNPLITNESGSTAVFRVRLNSQPTSNVVVNFRSSRTDEGRVAPTSLTFTSSNWDTAQQVTVTGLDDLVEDGNQLYRIITTVVSNDINYGGDPNVIPAAPPIDPLDVFVLNQDNEIAGFTVNPSTLVLTEGSTKTFSVRLNRQPANNNDVILNFRSANPSIATLDKERLIFTSTNWSTPQSVTVTAVDNFIRDGDKPFTIVTDPAISEDAQYSGLNPADVSGIVLDNEVAGVTVTPTTGLTTSEAGGSAIFTVRLNSQPTATVTIDLTSSDVTEGTVSPASLTFDATNWSTPQTVTVNGVDDFLDDGNVTYTITTSPAISTDTFYSSLNAADVSVTNVDNDTLGISVTPTAVPTNGIITQENGPPATFGVTLNSQPSSTVTITLTSGDPSEGLLAVELPAPTPTPGPTATPTVNPTTAPTPTTPVATPTPDPTAFPTSTPVATPTADPTAFPTSTPNPTSTPGPNPNPPIISPLSTRALSTPATSVTLTFTPQNFNVTQTVTILPQDDGFVDGNITYFVTGAISSSDTQYGALSFAPIRVTNLDDDSIGVAVTPTRLVTTEGGGPATFTVKLNSQPSGNVRLDMASSDPSEGTATPLTLVFTPTNYNVPQTVTVRPVDDLEQDGAQTYYIRMAPLVSGDPAYNGVTLQDVQVVNNDNDLAGVTVSTANLTTTEGGSAVTFILRLNSRPTANVTVNLTSTDTTEGAVTPASVTFTPADYGNRVVTVRPVDDAVKDGNVTYYINAAATSGDRFYNGIGIGRVRVVNNDNDTSGITITPTTGLRTSEAGGTASFAVRLTSQPTGNVVITFASSDTSEGTINKSSLTFTPVAGQPIAGNTSGWNVPQTVTITGVNDTAEDGDITYAITSSVTSGDPVYSSFRTPNVVVVNVDDGDDNTLPTVSIVQPTANQVVRTLTYASGTATDNRGLATVTVRIYRYGDNNNPAGYVAANGAVSATYNPALHELLATGTNSWIVRLPALTTGRYDLRATATDRKGNKATATRSFFIDQSPPVIQLTQPTATTYTTLSDVRGSVVDAGGGTVARVAVILYRYSSQGVTAGFFNGTTFVAGTTENVVTPGAGGQFTFALPALSTGRYYVQVKATDNFGNASQTPPITFNISNVSPTPVPTQPSQAPTYTPQQGFQLISVPYMDTTDVNATTSVDRAFSIPRVSSNGTVNYRIYEYDPVAEVYKNNPEGLLSNDLLRRGIGYFIQPLTGPVSQRIPATDATRRPFGGTTFDIVLRRNESNNPPTENAGFNLVGFPFDPLRFTRADWNTATVIFPSGLVVHSPEEARAAGVRFPELFEYNPTTGSYQAATELRPFRGYSTRTDVNGVIVRVTALP